MARLVPAPAYFPLRLRCARALNRLGEATRTFIPVAPVLLEVLQVGAGDGVGAAAGWWCGIGCSCVGCRLRIFLRAI